MKITVLQNILAANNHIAEETRGDLRKKRIVAVNIMSSPGAGKTAILERTLTALQDGIACGVVEGDITSTLDAARLAKFDVPVVQINTESFGGECHLSAAAVRQTLSALPLDRIRLLFIENVGNLVCPAEFDIGENAKVVVFSLPEGEDKPLKYPLMFRESKLCLLNKIDLAPALGAEIEKYEANVRQVNPALPIIRISARTGEGVQRWIAWLEKLVAAESAKSSTEA
jgi:hydrogenase nickel incorporation protein HypB